MNTLTTDPPIQPQAVDEDLTWDFDITALLTGAQTVTLAYGKLVDTSTQAQVALVDNVTIAGKVISQRVRAGVLTAQHTYRLTVIFTPSGTSNVLVSALSLTCPFGPVPAGIPALPNPYVLAARRIVAGTGLSGGGDLSTDRTVAVSFGTTAGTVADGGATATSMATKATPRGVWSSVTAYLANDVVTRTSGTYRALVGSTNVDPVGNPGTWESWQSGTYVQRAGDTLTGRLVGVDALNSADLTTARQVGLQGLLRDMGGHVLLYDTFRRADQVLASGAITEGITAPTGQRWGRDGLSTATMNIKNHRLCWDDQTTTDLSTVHGIAAVFLETIPMKVAAEVVFTAGPSTRQENATIGTCPVSFVAASVQLRSYRDNWWLFTTFFNGTITVYVSFAAGAYISAVGTLSGAFTPVAGGTVTSLPVTALPAAIPAGTIAINGADGKYTQSYTTVGAAAGATSIPVTAIASPFAIPGGYTFPSGSTVGTVTPLSGDGKRTYPMAMTLDPVSSAVTVMTPDGIVQPAASDPTFNTYWGNRACFQPGRPSATGATDGYVEFVGVAAGGVARASTGLASTLNLPGTQGSYVSAQRPTGTWPTVQDLTITADMSVNSYAVNTTQTLVGLWGAAGKQSFALVLNNNLKPSLYISLDGTASVIASATVAAPAGTTVTRAVYDPAAGAVTFSTSPDGVTFTTLGAVVSYGFSGGGPYYPFTPPAAVPVHVGSRNNASTLMLNGQVRGATIVVGGVTVMSLDCRVKWNGTSYADTQGNVWTLQGPPSSTGVSGWTWLLADAAFVTSPATAEHVSNKGAISGYAPLDTGRRVPAVNLPSGSGGLISANRSGGQLLLSGNPYRAANIASTMIRATWRYAPFSLDEAKTFTSFLVNVTTAGVAGGGAGTCQGMLALYAMDGTTRLPVGAPLLGLEAMVTPNLTAISQPVWTPGTAITIPAGDYYIGMAAIGNGVAFATSPIISCLIGSHPAIASNTFALNSGTGWQNTGTTETAPNPPVTAAGANAGPMVWGVLQ